jgi:endonuclease/exonuclease/phosphatase family metal-dependent hydrolase
VHIINTHFGLGREERRQQTDILLGRDWLGAIPNDEPVILCGDFNAGPRSFTSQQIQKRLRDVQEAAAHHKPRATFSSVQPLVRIDHIFVSPHFSVERIHVPDTPSAMTASDHLPLCVELGT